MLDARIRVGSEFKGSRHQSAKDISFNDCLDGAAEYLCMLEPTAST